MRQRRKSGLANGRLPANFGARSAARVRRQVERAELPRRPSYFLTEGYLIDATSGMDDAKEGEEELVEASSFAIGSADSGTHATAKM